MVEEFSPREIQLMFELPDSKSIVAERIQSSSRCKEKYASLVQLLKSDSIPTNSKATYKQWMDNTLTE